MEGEKRWREREMDGGGWATDGYTLVTLCWPLVFIKEGFSGTEEGQRWAFSCTFLCYFSFLVISVGAIRSSHSHPRYSSLLYKAKGSINNHRPLTQHGGNFWGLSSEYTSSSWSNKTVSLQKTCSKRLFFFGWGEAPQAFNTTLSYKLYIYIYFF